MAVVVWRELGTVRMVLMMGVKGMAGGRGREGRQCCIVPTIVLRWSVYCGTMTMLMLLGYVNVPRSCVVRRGYGERLMVMLGGAATAAELGI